MAIDIEAIIREARERGLFDNLPGQGQPIPEDEFKDLPEELRVTYRVLKGAGYSPSEVNLKKSIEEMRHKIRDELDPDRKNKLMMEMNRIETELNIKLEQMASKT